MRVTRQPGQLALRAVLVAGLLYGIIGLAFGAAAAGALTTQGRVGWRLAAWVVSGVVFAAHITYVQLRTRRPSPVFTALQASFGATLGALLLAMAATIHALWIGASNLGAFGLALLVWPAATAVLAFVAALVAAAGLTLLRPRV
jgi:hypothetical protein